MAFQLKAKEPVRDGILRNVRAQIEKAIIHVGALNSAKAKPHSAGTNRKPQTAEGAENEAVHEVRKCFKRVRAALRLVREDLGDDFYHEENWSIRDAARPLNLIRDADVLIQTADNLSQQFPCAVEPGAFAKIHEALVRNRETVICRVLNAQKAAAVAHDAASRALARLPDWQIAREGWAALEAGLRRVYRTGHRALALAAETSSMENLHEVRKQAKYLWHQLQLVEGVWTGTGKELIDQTHKLSTLLGEDHDLAVLRQTLAADPLSFGGHRVLKAVFAVIDGRREELEKEAFALGFEIYDDPSKIFITRIRAALSYGEKPGGGPNEEGQPNEGPAEGVEPGPAIEGRHRQGQTPSARKSRS